MNQQALSAFIWSVTDLLRGDYKQSEYGRVILPFTVLRRLDCVLAPTKQAVLAELENRQKLGINPEPVLLRASGQTFFNTSPLDMKKLMGDQDHIRENLFSYVSSFSSSVRDVLERFEFQGQVDRLAKCGLLYQATERFTQIDLHPDQVTNHQMGLIFEELIRKFAELSNETNGEHFTPREAIRLMVNLIFIKDDDVLSKPGVVRTIYDPTAGTGDMLVYNMLRVASVDLVVARMLGLRKANRRRTKTVMRSTMSICARITRHTRKVILHASCPEPCFKMASDLFYRLKTVYQKCN